MEPGHWYSIFRDASTPIRDISSLGVVCDEISMS